MKEVKKWFIVYFILGCPQLSSEFWSWFRNFIICCLRWPWGYASHACTKIKSTVNTFNVSGAEVAIYTSKYFPDFLKCLSSYKSGDLHKALEEAFIGFDSTLVEEAVVKQLKDIAGVELHGSSDDDEEGLLLLIELHNSVLFCAEFWICS